MNISLERLTAEAAKTGFRPDMLEKVIHLIGLLNAMQSHPFLKNKLALKGGTALNLFLFNVPRLSIDIDLNYVGTADREGMLSERPKLEQAIQAVFSREGFSVRRMPDEHAGGKWSLRYQSATGQGGNLEVDVNFMFRVPLWPLATLSSHNVGSYQATDIPVLDIHELAAGKLAALLARSQARDLFDSHQLLRRKDIDHEQLRIAFVVYGAMNRKDWRTVSADDVDFDAVELTRQLVPMLRTGALYEGEALVEYARLLVRECRESLSALLPLTKNESKFLDLLLDKGEIEPSLLTTDTELCDRIKRHPLLNWKAQNVRQHKDVF